MPQTLPLGESSCDDGHPIAYESCKLNDTERPSDGPGEGDDGNCALPSHMESNRRWGHDSWSKTGFVATSYFLTNLKLRRVATGTMASKTNFLRLIDMVREYKPGLLNNAKHTSLTVADTELSE